MIDNWHMCETSRALKPRLRFSLTANSPAYIFLSITNNPAYVFIDYKQPRLHIFIDHEQPRLRFHRSQTATLTFFIDHKQHRLRFLSITNSPASHATTRFPSPMAATSCTYCKASFWKIKTKSIFFVMQNVSVNRESECVCVCVCVRERERRGVRERERERDRYIEWERERERDGESCLPIVKKNHSGKWICLSVDNDKLYIFIV